MGPAQSTVINQSTNRICILTFNNTDLLYKSKLLLLLLLLIFLLSLLIIIAYHSMYILEPGDETLVEANPDAVGLKIGVCYMAKKETKEFFYLRYMVKTNAIFTISEIEGDEVSYYGDDISPTGKGKIKESDDIPFRMGMEAINNVPSTINAHYHYDKEPKEGTEQGKKGSDQGKKKKKDVAIVKDNGELNSLAIGGISLDFPDNIGDVVSAVKNKASEVKEKVKEKASEAKTKAKDLLKTKKEKEEEMKKEEERKRIEQEEKEREEEEARIAAEKWEAELLRVKEEARKQAEEEAEAMKAYLEQVRQQEEEEEEERLRQEQEEEAAAAAAQKKKGFGWGSKSNDKKDKDTKAPPITEGKLIPKLREKNRRTKRLANSSQRSKDSDPPGAPVVDNKCEVCVIM